MTFVLETLARSFLALCATRQTVSFLGFFLGLGVLSASTGWAHQPLGPDSQSAVTSATPGPSIIRYFYKDPGLVDELARAGADIPARTREFVEVVVPHPEDPRSLDPAVAKVLSKFDRQEVVVEDASLLDARLLDDPNLGAYHTLAEVKAELDQTVADHPGIARLAVAGHSLEGREIWALRIGSVSEDGVKPTFLFTGLHHAREWISVEVPMGLIKTLTEGYATDPSIKSLVDGREIWVVPVVNPDGHHFSQTQFKMWRKNRSNNGDGSIGVDPNRNYGYEWGGVGASPSPESDTYRGPSAFSEPCTQAIRDLAKAKKPAAAITFHSYSELILYPWGYSREATPDAAAFEKHARAMAAFNGYTPQQSIDLYPTTGDFDDYMYGELGILAYTIELGTQFVPPEAEIPGIVGANVKCCLYLLENAADPFPMMRVSELTATTDATGPYTVSANLDVRRWPDLTPKSIQLHHRHAGEDSFSAVDMAAVEGAAGAFAGSIPGAGYTSHEYYVAVEIDDQTSLRFPENGTYSFNVVENLILVVADDGGKGYESYYTEALESASRDFTIWRTDQRGVVDQTTLSASSAVIWFTGSQYTQTLTKDDQTNLTAYLQSGGRLFLAGQDLGYEIKATDFYRDVCRAKIVKDTSGDVNVVGEAGNLLEGLVSEIGQGTDGVSQRYPDSIEPLEGAKVLVRYGNDAVGGLTVETGTGRLVYLSFGLEGLNTAATRQSALGSVLDWLESGVSGSLQTINRHSMVESPEAMTMAEDERQSIANGIVEDLKAGDSSRLNELMAALRSVSGGPARRVGRLVYQRVVTEGLTSEAERLRPLLAH